MSQDYSERLLNFLKARDYVHEVIGDEVCVFLDRGVSIYVPKDRRATSYRIIFGRMRMATEMIVSITFFSLFLLFVLFGLKGDVPAYLPYLVMAIFVGNLLFEVGRYRAAKRVIEDLKHVI